MLQCSMYIFYQTTKRGDPNPKEIEQWLLQLTSTKPFKT